MTDKEDREKALSKAYTAATSRLRREHQDEFDKYRTEESDRLGVKWAARTKPRDAARQQVADLLSEFPELRDEMLADGSVTEPESEEEEGDGPGGDPV